MRGLGYTVPAGIAVLAVCAWELLFLRTGLFRRLAYWLSMLIVLGFQIPVDGWLTKLSAPVVEYTPRQITGLRGPWDIPVEDFLFGFALVTAALLLWERQGSRDPDGRDLSEQHRAEACEQRPTDRRQSR
jgi:lycopene cyclase domain-containing protein